MMTRVNGTLEGSVLGRKWRPLVDSVFFCADCIDGGQPLAYERWADEATPWWYKFGYVSYE
jgi:hypothetical protein